MLVPRMLIVEDNEIVRRMCRRALRAEGYQVAEAESGEQAVGRLGEEWDVILTDLLMPGTVDGLEVLRQAKTHGHADVILMTGNPELESAVEAVRGGAYDYLVKPFTADVPVLAVKRCLAKRAISVALEREKALREDLERAYRSLAQLERVKKVFGQFATPEVAQFVLQSPESMWRRGVRREVTMLFADVRGFTWFTEDSPPEEVVDVLNQLLAILVGAVQREGGLLNKFVGDGIVAVFGAPILMPDHAAAAARAALRAQAEVEEMAKARKRRHLVPLRVGIGLNTGEVVAGCLGTDDRAEYSVIGHTVNLAARLEHAAGPHEILVGPATAKLLEGSFQMEPRPPQSFPGVAEPLPVFQLKNAVLSPVMPLPR